MGAVAGIAGSVLGGAASGLAGGGGSSKGGGTQSYWQGLAPWVRDMIQQRAMEPLDDLRNQWMGQFKAGIGRTFPAMRKALNTNYALRGLDRSGFMADAVRKSYEQQAGAQMDFTAKLPGMLNQERANRIAMATGPAQQLPQQPYTNPWMSAVGGAATGLGNYYQQQGFLNSMQPTSIAPSYQAYQPNYMQGSYAAKPYNMADYNYGNKYY